MRTAPSKFWTFLIALFIGLGVTALGAVSPAAADAGITLDKKAPGSVLLGDNIPYELTAKNVSSPAVPQYNIGFSDILPAGFEYVGSTDPLSAGEPTATPISGGRTLLIWNNVTDLQPASSFTLKFSAKPKTPIPTTIIPVDRNTAYVAGSTDERKVPKFNNNGTPVGDTAVVSATDTADTKRAPFVVEKTNTNSPEGELIRGVHDQRSTYTLTIRNNKRVATNGVTLTDYLPAQLEFLGCGDVDNSVVVTEEYPGSGPLGDPKVNPVPCPLPISVETVDSPQDVPGLGNLSGVHTAVTWNVGDLAAGEEKEIKYVAGIPLSENTTTWDSPEPIAASLEQGSNLDNNNGGSTRELTDEQSITNKVSATGVFTGTAPTSPSIVTEEHTVTIEDVRMQKSVSPSDRFTPGGTATFTMKIEASEYMDASNTVVTDTLPDGYCPLGATGSTYWPGEATCTALAGDPKPSPGFSSVTWNAGPGNYTVIFNPVPEIKANQSAIVTLPARMLDTYRKTSQPTVAGDNFVNTVELTAETNAIKDNAGNPVEPGEVTVGDDSRAEQGTPLPTISKQIKPRQAPSTQTPDGMKCDPAVAPPYVSDPDPRPSFRKGDVICFKLRVDFPSSIKTKNAVVTDFPPVGTEFVVDNDPATGNNAYAVTGNNNVPRSVVLTPTKFVITLGNGGFVSKGGVFEATFAVVVLKPGTGTKPEITGNLMKMRTENTAGVAQSYRDQAEYDLLPPPNLLIDKGVIATDKPAATYPTVSPLQDNKPIEQGGTATFQINVENRPQIPGSDYSVRGVQVWDRLPEQLTCSAVNLSALQFVQPRTGAQLPLPGGIAKCDDAPGESILKWVFPSPDLDNDYAVDVGQTLSLIYAMKVPDVAAAGTNYANTAGVRQYEAFTDIPGITATYIPKENIDPTQDANADAPKLIDPSNVFIPGVTVDKDAETSVTETNNDLKTQATIGETITYTYSVTIAKGSTVYRGVLSDVPLPTGIQFVSATAELEGSPSLPSDFEFDQTTGTLKFPKVYSATETNKKFIVTMTAKVGQSAASCNAATCDIPPVPDTDVKKTNTATFESFTAETGGTRTATTKTYDIFVVQPNPSIGKNANPTSVTSTSTDITYTLTAKTPSDRPPLHDVTIIDCVPDTLTIKAGSVSDSGVVGSACDLPNNAGTGVTITWGPFDPLVPGTDKVVTYVANIKPGSPADVKFKNTVGMSGTSMPGTVAGERTYLTGANEEVFITGASIDKSLTPSVATIGETVSYTIATKLPDAAYTNLVVLDTLPPYIDYADVSDITLGCSTTDSNYANPGDCSSGVSATFLGPVPGSPGATGQQIGWSFNELPDQTKHRIIRITYKSRVSNLPQNAAGATRTNTASAGYGYASQPTTLAQAQNPPKTIGSDVAPLTLTEPNVKIEKLVNSQDAITALPDDTFGYTIKVTNPQRAGGVPTSTAYAVKVRDCVPDGISVVDAGTGTLGTDNTCTTTEKASITWDPIASLAVGGSQPYTYTAKLKGNTTTAQTNVVSALEWSSLTPDPNNPDIRKYGPITADAVVTPVLPDVKIEKKASDALAYIDQPYSWTIEVTNPSTRNPGPTAYQVKVGDVLPPNWTYKAGTTVIKLDGAEISTTDPTEDTTNPLAVKLAWNTGTDLPVNKKIIGHIPGHPWKPTVALPDRQPGRRHDDPAHQHRQHHLEPGQTD
ncbi:MAG: isopeptide-forming domain-containing fimbrial protein [Candidatus Nanopelagicales bacterium]